MFRGMLSATGTDGTVISVPLEVPAGFTGAIVFGNYAAETKVEFKDRMFLVAAAPPRALVDWPFPKVPLHIFFLRNGQLQDSIYIGEFTYGWSFFKFHFMVCLICWL